ncbi:FMN-binding negative transcriptional regulator [Mucilaginibacter daejeonensis]|uniref:FMN-binding negative transcriptional regulator n=1 Tax=Mucilaginibacter daejeonensis TaxID=398049 RepID=UPI001D17CD72|nr:FMN-binding negative transcriptional regulator [Mucilaginibacter daejeonensis]UEG51548.1 FMN-binding negative transcriptional regulator [Mucilaginibacter daejeonensis]
MYTPKNFELTDVSEAVAFMQRYSFATLINSANGIPEATHLPFVIKQDGDEVILSSHLAKPNPQSGSLLEGTSLVIFSEPHAYIAPKHYEKELNVPTWNYIAIHAYGTATIVTDEELQLASLEEMITSYDADYVNQWASLPMDYKLKLVKGITVFDITVTDLQGKKKLSQNRTDVDRQNVINALSNSHDANEQEIARYMQAEFKK